MSAYKEARELIEPIPMLLWCPVCGERHIDEGEFAIKPHHTHACQRCGHVWRPAIGATCGVQFLPGFKQDEHMNDLTFLDALRIARGCTDYGGGYVGNREHYDIYQRGIATVIRALEAAADHGLKDRQVGTLHSIGSGDTT